MSTSRVPYKPAIARTFLIATLITALLLLGAFPATALGAADNDDRANATLIGALPFTNWRSFRALAPASA